MERLKNCAIFVVACAVALAGLETALRLWGDDVLAMGNQFRFYRFDEGLGWSNAPNASGYFARSEYRHFIRINSAGMRDREPMLADGAARRIAVMGDSFTWGVGADYGERFTEILERDRPGLDVLNYGVSGFGTVQHLIQLETVLAARPDRVVLVLCLSNDVMETFMPFRSGYAKPFVRRGGDGQLEIAGYPLVNVKAIGGNLVGADSELRLAALVNLVKRKLDGPHPALSDPRLRPDLLTGSELYIPDDRLDPATLARKHAAFDMHAELLGRMDRMVTKAIGPGRFEVVLAPTKMESIPAEVPDGERGSEMGDQILARLKAAGIRAVDPRAQFTAEHFWRRDGHWNARGHRLFATVLEKALDLH